MVQRRWAPTLPSFGGRLAPRIELPEGYPSDYNSKLELYYLERQSCLSIFTHNVGMKVLRGLFPEIVHRYYGRQTPSFRDLTADQQYRYLVRTLGKITMSPHFLRSLKKLCYSGNIATIKRWWQTTDAIVLPLLLSVDNPDEHYQDIDLLIKFSMEMCANNYAHFISRMKSLKRLLRKDYAENKSSASTFYDCRTYWNVFLKHYPTDGANPHRIVQYILCWAQTRASGLADSVMIKQSLDKCELTLKTPRRPVWKSTPKTREYKYRGLPRYEPQVPEDILSNVAWRVSGKVRGELAHISAGPNACIESTRQTGGQTGYIKALTKVNVLHHVYDYRTLSAVKIKPRPIRSQHDLLSWAVQETLHHPTYVRCVRLHSVPEPSKARTITVCTLPYLIVVGVLAKVLQPAIASDITRAGLRATRNLWNFLFNDMDPNMGLWARLRDSEPRQSPIMALSSDLSEATDYGDLGVARQILHGILEKCSSIPGFPIGLAQLAKTLFIGKRFCWRHHDGAGYRFFVKRNGWLMGDRLTKVLLTLAHEIVVISSGLHCARICGDDIIAFSRDRKSLEKYLDEVQRLGFKVSWEDTYISSRLGFYCEEACIPMQRFRELPSVCVRRKDQSMYIDYPRIRLLIPTQLETHAYSYTDIGRFSLLGKETRWVHQNKLVKSVPLFTRATLLQHLMVPMPSDTLCPFLPVQIGGDGAFPHSPHFLQEVVERKTIHLDALREAQYRIWALLTSKWGYRFVRSANLNEVVHKYHVLLPRIEELRRLIPAEAVIDGNQLLLNSIKIDGVESPERTFFRIWRAFYWHCVFTRGEDPPPLLMEADRRFCPPNTDTNLVASDYSRFYLVWKDSGFTFMDVPDYLVETRLVHVLDYMNLGWHFGIQPRPDSRLPSLELMGGRSLFNEENIQSFIDHMKDGRPLNPRVTETLYKYVEADSYILTEFHRRAHRGDVPRFVILVSGDRRLASNIARIQRALLRWDPEDSSSDEPGVYLVHPEAYMFGMMYEYEEYIKRVHSIPEAEVIVDFGATNYCAFTMSGIGVHMDGFTVQCWVSRYPGVKILAPVPHSDVSHETWSLTTQLPDQIRRTFLR